MEKLRAHIDSPHHTAAGATAADLLAEPTQILILDPLVLGDPSKSALFG
ncbi:MAG: hypothetical protein KDC33_00305 [Thermoleophilia bacterium]|nr:hypothetical protein [Thermoleophilia bacterium]